MNNKDIEIVPAIIPQDLNLVKERLQKIVGIVDRVQLDIVDGHYAHSITWPLIGDQYEERIRMVNGEEKFPFIEDFKFEIDLLLFHPIEYIGDFISLGAKSFVIHIDSTDHVRECIDSIKLAGCLVGLGIKPSVETTLLDPYIDDIDFVQFMGNDKVGRNGVSLDPLVLEKIKSFHHLHPNLPLQIDIGVNKETISSLRDAGITTFISGSAVFNAPNPKQAIEELKNLSKNI